MSVHDLCTATGVTRKALYYYDKIGLLKPAHRRGTQKAKLYGDKEIERLNEILRYQSAGLSLNEIREMLDGTYEQQLCTLHAVVHRLHQEADALQKEIRTAEAFLHHLVNEKNPR